jgi:nitroimidazol reductase NimA-like FMN-containing flavoprotein (pyridoxamine 5'-phosphate oxidase superfamily)
MTDRKPVAASSLGDDDAPASPWALAEERLANPEKGRTYWLATVRPDGRPHVMPLIGMWFEDAFYFLTGERTRKGRNLAGDPHCVITGSSTALPSLDIIIEGDARKVTDEKPLRRVVEAFGSKLEWPLEVRGDAVHGPNAPSAGPPPYSVFRLVPSVVFGLPGTLGMEGFDPADLPRPTRWEFQR